MRSRSREDYAAEVTEAVGTLQARFPGRVPAATIALLAEDLCGEGADPRDIRAAVAGLARASSHYDERQLRDHLAAARRRREDAEQAPRLALVASNPRGSSDRRAGDIVARIIARAVMRDPRAFAAVAPEVLTARQNRLRESIQRAIDAEPAVTDAALLERFGRAG
jgi:hypothetical protein